MVTLEMLGAIAAHVRVTTIDTSPRSLARGARYHLRRLLRVLQGLPRILLARMQGVRTLYMPLDEGMGGIWNLAFLLIARATGMRLFLHHHSFRYISDRTGLMAVIVAIAGPEACHVVLCPTMEARLRALYPRIGDSFVAPNPVAEPLKPRSGIGSVGTTPTIGMLANLTFEKGVAAFVELIETMPDIRGILAGPADPAVGRFIETAVARLHPRLSWLGPVSGETKETFFEAIDVFVFPTRYRTEAYPLVLAEALIRGVGVIAPDRGCIGALAALEAVDVVGPADDFVACTTVLLRAGFADARDRSERRAAVRSQGEALNRANATIRQRLVAAIAMSATTSVTSAR